MSYILDALNKSEQEREKGRTPNLKTVHETRPSKKSLPWSLIFVTLTLAAVSLMAWYFYSGLTVPDAHATKVTNLSAPSAQSPAADSPIPKAVPEPQSPVKQMPAPSFTAGESVSGMGLVRTRIAFHELPEAVQIALPDLVFSSHIYAEDASLRMVNINSSSFKEGEAVSSGLLIAAITEDGVAFQFQGYEFEMSVLRDWHSP